MSKVVSFFRPAHYLSNKLSHCSIKRNGAERYLCSPFMIFDDTVIMTIKKWGLGENSPNFYLKDWTEKEKRKKSIKGQAASFLSKLKVPHHNKPADRRPRVALVLSVWRAKLGPLVIVIVIRLEPLKTQTPTRKFTSLLLSEEISVFRLFIYVFCDPIAAASQSASRELRRVV